MTASGTWHTTGKLGRKSRLLSHFFRHTAGTYLNDNIMALVFGGEVQPCLHILHQAHILLQHLQGKEECLSSLLQVPPASFSHPSHKTFQGYWSHRLDPFLPKATSDQDKTAQDPRGSKALLTKLGVLGYLVPMGRINHCQPD